MTIAMRDTRRSVLLAVLAMVVMCCTCVAGQDDSSSSSSSTGSSPTPPPTPPPPSCLPLPVSSVCASFFPSGATVYTPLFTCMETAEASLKSAPVVWSSLTQLLSMNPATANSTCTGDMASLMCLLTFRPCEATTLSRPVCQATLDPAMGSCASMLPFLGLVIQGFSLVFNCAGPFYSPAGVGPFNPVVPSTYVPAPMCVPLPADSVCRGVIVPQNVTAYPVYAPWSARGSLEATEALVRLSLQSAMVSASPWTGCLESASKMLCSLVYPRCDTTVLATSLAGKINGPMAGIVGLLKVPFPQLPCSTLCEQVNDGRCGELLASSASFRSRANCTGSGLVLRPTPICNGAFLPDGQPNFVLPGERALLAKLTVNNTQVDITSQCNAFNTPSEGAIARAMSVVTCPYPLVPTAGPGDAAAVLHGSCALPCPTILFSRGEWAEADRFFTGIVICSFFSSVILWLTWVIFPVKRKQTNTLMFNTCTLVLAFATLVMIIDTGGKPSAVSCKDASEYKVQQDGGTCLFQAMVFFYFTLVGVGFWLVSALDLYIKIVMGLKIDLQRQTKLNRTYLVVCWGVPMILLIVALGLKAFGGANGTPWCLFNPTNTSATDWSLFYYPILFMVVTGAFFMCSIIWRMVRSAADSGGVRKKGWWKTQVRPFLFVFIFIFIFIFIFAYRVHLWRKEADYKLQAQIWVACIIQTMGDNQACGDKPADTPALGLWYMIQLAVGAEGLLNSIIFGSQWVNVQLWWGLLTCKGTAGSSSRTDDSHSRSVRLSSKREGTTPRGVTRQNSGKLDSSRGDDAPAVKPASHVSGVNAVSTAREAVLAHMLDPELLQPSPASPSRGHHAASVQPDDVRVEARGEGEEQSDQGARMQ